jgi:hypothetical protein
MMSRAPLAFVLVVTVTTPWRAVEGQRLPPTITPYAPTAGEAPVKRAA